MSLRRVLAVLAVTTFTCAGCASQPDDAIGAEGVESADPELATADFEQLTLVLSPEDGGRSTSPGWERCTRSGRWTVKWDPHPVIEGRACPWGLERDVRRGLHDDQVAEIKRAIRGIRLARRIPACSTEAPRASIELLRNGKRSAYVDARAACTSDATPVTGSTMEGLVEVIERLGMPDEPGWTNPIHG